MGLDMLDRSLHCGRGRRSGVGVASERQEGERQSTLQDLTPHHTSSVIKDEHITAQMAVHYGQLFPLEFV